MTLGAAAGVTEEGGEDHDLQFDWLPKVCDEYHTDLHYELEQAP